MTRLILTLILIGGIIAISCKSNTEPNGQPQPTEPTKKDTTEAKAWVSNINGKTFEQKYTSPDSSDLSTYKFLENGDIEYLVVTTFTNGSKESNLSSFYFWGALDGYRGIYYYKDDEDSKIYYQGYKFSNNNNILYATESSKSTSEIVWKEHMAEVGTLVE